MLCALLVLAALTAAAPARAVSACGDFSSVLDGTTVRVGESVDIHWTANDYFLEITVSWGDGLQDSIKLSPGQEGDTAHVYAAPGTYHPSDSITATTSAGLVCHDVLPEGTVIVRNPAPTCGPLPPFAPGTSAAIGQMVRYSIFHAFGSGTLRATIQWGDGTATNHSFGDGERFGFLHSYGSPGTYTLTEVATGAYSNGTACRSDLSLGSITVVPGARTRLTRPHRVKRHRSRTAAPRPHRSAHGGHFRP